MDDDLGFGRLSLNYKLLDTEQVIELSKDSPNTVADDSDSDVVTELLPRPIPFKVRRRSSVGSYEVDLKELQSKHKPRLSDFESLRVLGQGSYGKVLLVRERSTGRLFAQKQLRKALLMINDEIHQTNYQRTINEKTILEHVHHPNIVTLYYAFQDNDKVYLILEYLQGGELFHHLAQQKFLSEKDALYYVAQIALALRYLHLHLHVIYRDLKPENCLLNLHGNLVLTDFGLSKMSDETDRKHSIIGTAQYMAPEVIKGEEYAYNVDWWSLGCVAFDMLTGLPPFTGATNDKIMDKVLQSKKYLKFPFYLSQDAKDLLQKLLQPNPSKRFDVDNDFERFKKLRFFRHVDWNLLENPDDEVVPPIFPVITDPALAENFDDEFTGMAFTPPDSARGEEVLHVNGFSFTHESLLHRFKGRDSL